MEEEIKAPEETLDTVSVDATEMESDETPTASAAEVLSDLRNVLKALLFATEDPLSPAKLRELLKVNVDARDLRRAVQEINQELQSRREPFEVAEVAGGYQFRTIPGYHKYVKGLFKDRAMRRLSQQALETLAIIAYKQPASRSEIEGIRSVSTEASLKTLLERRLIALLGRSDEKPGKPLVYGTTKDFLKYFGLNKISDLPKLEEFEDIAKAQEQGKSHLINDFKRDAETTTTLSPSAPVAVPVETVAETLAETDETPPADVAGDSPAVS